MSSKVVKGKNKAVPPSVFMKMNLEDDDEPNTNESECDNKDVCPDIIKSNEPMMHSSHKKKVMTRE